jgi:hypothetical protein
MKNNLQNRRKASRQSKEYKKTRKDQKCEDLWLPSCHDGFHRVTVASTVPRWKLLARQDINRRKYEENLFIVLRWPSSWYDGFTWRPS